MSTKPSKRTERSGTSSIKKKPTSKNEISKDSGGSSQLWYISLIVGAIAVGIVSTVLLRNVPGEHGVKTFSEVWNISYKLEYLVQCSKDYAQESFHSCKPKKCGRVVMDHLVTEEEALHLLMVAKRGLSYGGSAGGASILDLHSGALSKNDKFINIYSILSDKDSFTESDFTIYRQIKDKIHQAISDHFNIPLSKLYLTKPTFFSRMNTTEAKTVHDEYWHPHIDKITYGSFHYTSLLYLSTYKQDFTGGRFIFVDKDANRTVEPRLGRVSFFTSGSENVHFVEKLKSGTRYAITISFTCDPDMSISDPTVR